MINEILDCCNNLEYEKLSLNDYPKSLLQFAEVFNSFTLVDE